MKLTEEEQSAMYDRVKENTYDISSIAKRMDSYHLDTKAQIKDLKDSVVSKEEIRLLFIDESRKIAEGINKRIDENKAYCDASEKLQNQKIEDLISYKQKQTGFVGGISWLSGVIYTFVGGIAGWVVNKFFS